MNSIERAYKSILLEAYIESSIDSINESYEAYKNHLITEDSFLSKIGNFFRELATSFRTVKESLSKGWGAFKKACSWLFNLIPIQELLQYAGITASALTSFSIALKSCIIIVPATKIGYEAYKRTKEEIQSDDVDTLIEKNRQDDKSETKDNTDSNTDSAENDEVEVVIDKEKLRDETKKFFKDQSFFKKAITFILKMSKNLGILILENLPMIFKCIVGYALTDAFQKSIGKKSIVRRAGEKAGDTAADVAISIGRKNPVYYRMPVCKTTEEALDEADKAYADLIANGEIPGGLLGYNNLSKGRNQGAGTSWLDYDPKRNPGSMRKQDGSLNNEMPLGEMLKKGPGGADILGNLDPNLGLGY